MKTMTTVDFGHFGVRTDRPDLVNAIYEAADDGGIIQAWDMMALGCFSPEHHTTTSMHEAFAAIGAEVVDFD